MRSAPHFAVFSSRTRTASVSNGGKVSGAAARLPVARETNLVRSLKYLQEQGYFVVGLAGDGEVNVADADMATVPLVLVTGSEGGGLSRLVRDTCDLIVSIPIDIATESLNAAVATGIALYQIDQDRKAGTA
ncbi:23S rRNA (guanosine-2'-O-)-methyltransferase RlmB [Trueperella pyogenes]|nr:23S rRNA (guanosine-2'-O-)-methyltransferase RlmB [Trueperella pyogenes]